MRRVHGEAQRERLDKMISSIAVIDAVPPPPKSFTEEAPSHPAVVETIVDSPPRCSRVLATRSTIWSDDEWRSIDASSTVPITMPTNIFPTSTSDGVMALTKVEATATLTARPKLRDPQRSTTPVKQGHRETSNHEAHEKAITASLPDGFKLIKQSDRRVHRVASSRTSSTYRLLTACTAVSARSTTQWLHDILYVP